MRACNCPNCNASLAIDDENRDFTFCQYCGTKIQLDDYRSTHKVIDQAKLKQIEVEGEIRLRELKIKEAQINQKNQLRKILTYIWICSIFVVALLCLIVWKTNDTLGGMAAFLCLIYVGGPIVGGGAYLIFKVIPDKEIERELLQNGGVRAPKNLGVLSEQNYVAVQQTLLNAGFYNITCINMHDVTLGLLQKPGLVESVTVNGKPFVFGGKVYMPNVPIVITYHGR